MKSLISWSFNAKPPDAKPQSYLSLRLCGFALRLSSRRTQSIALKRCLSGKRVFLSGAFPRSDCNPDSPGRGSRHSVGPGSPRTQAKQPHCYSASSRIHVHQFDKYWRECLEQYEADSCISPLESDRIPLSFSLLANNVSLYQGHHIGGPACSKER